MFLFVSKILHSCVCVSHISLNFTEYDTNTDNFKGSLEAVVFMFVTVNFLCRTFLNIFT